MGAVIRLFVALRPPVPIRQRLLSLVGGVPGARWQDDDQLHLTVRFIGEVERPQAEDVAVALEQVRAPAAPMALAGVGCFDQRGRPAALWVGVAPTAPLAALHRKIDAACQRAGLAPDRRAYKPHITLARFGRAAGTGPELDRWLAEHAALASEPFACPHLVLYQSMLGRDGASYEPVTRWPLDPA